MEEKESFCGRLRAQQLLIDMVTKQANKETIKKVNPEDQPISDQQTSLLFSPHHELEVIEKSH